MDLYVGVSGGVDSMYLLSTLIQEKGLKDKLVCLNFDHGDAFSTSAADLVRDYCIHNGVRFIINTIDSSICKGNKEGYWREERYKFFMKYVKEGTLLLAHHMTDQYVSWIMSRLKNSNRCFIPILNKYGSMNVVRPLYLTNKDEIKEYIKSNNIPYLEDPTNVVGNRGRTELELIPLIEDVMPQSRGAFRKVYMDYLKKHNYPIDVSNINGVFIQNLINSGKSSNTLLGRRRVDVRCFIRRPKELSRLSCTY